jgi:uncharacterized protein (TIGR03086 family)
MTSSDIADRFRRRADAFELLIDGSAPERWSNPSPCAGWSALDVVAHVVDFSAQVLREQAGISETISFADQPDPVVAFRLIRRAVEQVLDDPETPPRVSNYLDASVSLDLPQHGWDLAKSTGQDATMDPEVVQLLWDSLIEHAAVWDWQRANGWYAAPVEVSEDAPLSDRVLGLLGRDPAWTPPA